ncbi:MAG: ATP-dependent Clp protease adapter ClpS [bacterium]
MTLKGNLNKERLNEHKTETVKPDLYKVYLLNDDYTTMDFVVYILMTIFNKDELEATKIMLHVHNNGKGLAGIYIKDIAESKVIAVHNLATKNGFPLKCSIEKE